MFAPLAAAATLSLALIVTSLPVRAGREPQRRPARACGSALDYQVRLDRLGFSPGEIDGSFGRNTLFAIRAFQDASGPGGSGRPDCDTWQDLVARDNVPTLGAYTISPDDVAGPFVERIPEDLVEQAGLPALSFTSPLEALGEKFHVSPALLKRLNPGAAFVEGETIRVPNLTSPSAMSLGPTAATPLDSTVTVSRANSSLRVLSADGRVVFFAPATIGSQNDPLPLGEWKVTEVAWDPVFRYNPELFWDADPGHAKATIQPGPNGPAGVVWIGLDVEHYGIHGTPEPSQIGHRQSHGCVRLTNWDAARVGRLVRRNTPVLFTER